MTNLVRLHARPPEHVELCRRTRSALIEALDTLVLYETTDRASDVAWLLTSRMDDLLDVAARMRRAASDVHFGIEGRAA